MSAILSYPKFSSHSAVGVALAGGLLYTYASGTTTAKTSYTTQDMSVAQANPVVLDANGEAVIWLNGEYKLILKDSDGVTQWTVDNVSGWGGSGLFNEIIKPTSGTLTIEEVTNTRINNRGQSADVNTQTLPTAAEGYKSGVSIGTTKSGYGEFNLKAGPTDKIYLDGTALDDGDMVTLATPAIGDCFDFWTFETASGVYDWIVVTGIGTLSDGGA